MCQAKRLLLYTEQFIWGPEVNHFTWHLEYLNLFYILHDRSGGSGI